jgi:hypothetical protein
METVYTVIQALLGIVFLEAGASHIRAVRSGTYSPQMAWIAAVPRNLMLAIGALEILAGIVLLGTLVTGTTALAALTAACLALLMVFAIVFHARRAGELPNIAFNAILGVLALVVVYANLT